MRARPTVPVVPRLWAGRGPLGSPYTVEEGRNMRDVVMTNARGKPQVQTFSSLMPRPAMTVSMGRRSVDELQASPQY